MDDIVADTNKINLDAELAAIRVALAAAEQAGRDRIEHAIEAGSHVLKVKAHIKRKDGGLRGWLQVHGLSKTVCYDYMLLAKNAESVRSSGHSSIATALRKLRARSGESKKPKSFILTGDPSVDAQVNIVEPDPYAPETLIKLPASDRARILTALNITRADVPSNIVTEIVQHAISQERSSTAAQQKQMQKCIEKVRSAVMTNEAPTRQVENIRAVIGTYGRGTSDWCDRMDLEASSFIKAKAKRSAGSVLAALVHPPSDTKH